MTCTVVTPEMWLSFIESISQIIGISVVLALIVLYVFVLPVLDRFVTPVVEAFTDRQAARIVERIVKGRK